MNDAVLILLRRLGVELGLPFNPGGSEARPCRAGQLYRVHLGGRPFALKLYDEAGSRRALSTSRNQCGRRRRSPQSC